MLATAWDKYSEHDQDDGDADDDNDEENCDGGGDDDDDDAKYDDNGCAFPFLFFSVGSKPSPYLLMSMRKSPPTVNM